MIGTAAGRQQVACQQDVGPLRTIDHLRDPDLGSEAAEAIGVSAERGDPSVMRRIMRRSATRTASSRSSSKAMATRWVRVSAKGASRYAALTRPTRNTPSRPVLTAVRQTSPSPTDRSEPEVATGRRSVAPGPSSRLSMLPPKAPGTTEVTLPWKTADAVPMTPKKGRAGMSTPHGVPMRPRCRSIGRWMVLAVSTGSGSASNPGLTRLYPCRRRARRRGAQSAARRRAPHPRPVRSGYGGRWTAPGRPGWHAAPGGPSGLHRLAASRRARR